MGGGCLLEFLALLLFFHISLEEKLKILVKIFTLLFIINLSSEELSVDIDISEQRLYLYEGSTLIKSYPVSSSYYGEGEIENSYKTPLGIHAVEQMIGQNNPKNTIYVNRESYSQIADIITEAVDNEEDFITSRVMWLSGLEPGFNQGGNRDSFNRFIYIHGTHEEGLIGKKASHGCIRMLNHDVIELFDLLDKGTKVNIKL